MSAVLQVFGATEGVLVPLQVVGAPKMVLAGLLV